MIATHAFGARLAAGCLVLALGAASPGAGAMAGGDRAEGSFRGVYDVHVGGLKAGEFAFEARLDGAGYRARLTGRTAGFVEMLYRLSFEAETQGAVTPGGLVPSLYTADAVERGTPRTVELSYDGGEPASLAVRPPFEPEPWRLDPIEQTGSKDPVSALLSGLALQSADALCERRVEVFDGRRRYAISFGTPEPAGEGRIRCPALYSRVAGFEPDRMAEPDWPFAVWFEEGTDGFWHASRAEVELSLGTLVVRLRDAA
jgi:hypothetical protein